MNFEEWVLTVPEEITQDPLWNAAVYRQALFLADLTWIDTKKLVHNKSTISLADQLYRAVCGISANISEGYGRFSGKDQARYYEYALGSARESRDWYYKSRHILGEEVIQHRLKLLTHIIRQLIVMVPKYRGKRISETNGEYLLSENEELFADVPIE